MNVRVINLPAINEQNQAIAKHIIDYAKDESLFVYSEGKVVAKPSWSEYYSQILAQANRSEKQVIHSCAKTIYKFYISDFSVDDCIQYVRGSRI